MLIIKLFVLCLQYVVRFVLDTLMLDTDFGQLAVVDCRLVQVKENDHVDWQHKRIIAHFNNQIFGG